MFISTEITQQLENILLDCKEFPVFDIDGPYEKRYIPDNDVQTFYAGHTGISLDSNGEES